MCRRLRLHLNPYNCLGGYDGNSRQCLSSVEVNLTSRPKENRIYIRDEFSQSLRMNFVSPFQPVKELKVDNLSKCSQIRHSTSH